MLLKWKAGHNKFDGYYQKVACDFDGDNGHNEVDKAIVVDDLKVLSAVTLILVNLGF